MGIRLKAMASVLVLVAPLCAPPSVVGEQAVQSNVRACALPVRRDAFFGDRIMNIFKELIMLCVPDSKLIFFFK